MGHDSPLFARFAPIRPPAAARAMEQGEDGGEEEAAPPARETAGHMPMLQWLGVPNLAPREVANVDRLRASVPDDGLVPDALLPPGGGDAAQELRQDVGMCDVPAGSFLTQPVDLLCTMPPSMQRFLNASDSG